MNSTDSSTAPMPKNTFQVEEEREFYRNYVAGFEED